MFGGGFAAAFACVFESRMQSCELEDAFVHQCVVDDDVCLAKRVERVQGQQARITGASAAEPDPARLHCGPVALGKRIRSHGGVMDPSPLFSKQIRDAI